MFIATGVGADSHSARSEMCLRIMAHMELLTEFAGPAFRFYKHATPDGAQELVLQMSKLHPPTKVGGVAPVVTRRH